MVNKYKDRHVEDDVLAKYNNNMTTIKISKDFKEWLTKKGKKMETYEMIIKRLIKN